jgi:hypothetical protein
VNDEKAALELLLGAEATADLMSRYAE